MASKKIMKWGIKKLIDDVHSKYSGLLALLSGEPISASAKTSNPFCFRGLRPLDPQRGAAPVPRWGPRRPPDPSPPGGASGPQCRLLTLILRLLPIILTTLKMQLWKKLNLEHCTVFL